MTKISPAQAELEPADLFTTVRFRRGCLLAVITACLGALGCAAPKAPKRPNVVLILLDTFRPDHLGINGYGRRTAPFLEQLMERSTVFGQAFSTSSWTAPATGSLFTGFYPNRHGVTEGFVAHGDRVVNVDDLVGETIRLNRLPTGVATAPELLQQAGYSTFGLAANINIGPEIGFDRGFDRFRRMKDRSAVDLVEVITGWRSEITASSPYFLYLHLNDTHQPYHPREPWYRGGTDEHDRSVAAYDSEISYLDRALEKLYRELDWQRNTLLLVASDHGEELGERGRFGHGFSLRQNLIRALLVIAGPDLGIPARRVAMPVSLIDVLPTLLELVSVPIPEGRDGLSMARLLGSDEIRPEALRSRILFAHRTRRHGSDSGTEHLWAALRMPFKLIVRPGAEPRLLDLSREPGKRADLADQRPNEAAELSAALAGAQSAARLDGEQVEVEIDRETLESLKSLGYVR